MPKEMNFDSFMAERRSAPVATMPVAGEDFGSFMQSRRPQLTRSGPEGQPSEPAGLPHPDIVEQQTTAHARTLATLLTRPQAPRGPQMILPEQEPAPPPMMISRDGVMRRVPGTEAYRGATTGSLTVPGSKPTGEQLAGGGPAFNAPAGPETMPLRHLVRQVAETPIVTPEDIDTSFPFLVGPFRLHAGALKAAAGMTSPENAAITAATGGIGAARGVTARLLQSGVSAYFATQGGKSLLEKCPQMKDRVAAKDWSAVMELGGGALADAAIVYGAARHSAAELKAVPNEFIRGRIRKYAKQIEIARQESATQAGDGKVFGDLNFDAFMETRNAPEEEASHDQPKESLHRPAPVAREPEIAGTGEEHPSGLAQGSGRSAASERAPNIGQANEATPPVDGTIAKETDHESAKSHSDPINEQWAAVPRSAAGIRPQGRGKPTRVLIPDTDLKHEARYRLRELSELKPSHHAFSFQEDPDYPYTNDRDYTRPENQKRVIMQGQKFEPSYLLNTNPTAGDGPPVVDHQGNVIGGNSRVMSLQRVFAQHREQELAYRSLLAENADHFGIDQEHIASMRQPVLVRETSPGAAQEVQRAITDLNKTGTAKLGTSEQAMVDSKRVSPDTLESIQSRIGRLGEDGSLAKVLASEGGPEIVNRLVADGAITEREAPQYIADGKVTPEGKTRIGRLMIGRFFSDVKQFDETPGGLRNKLERIVSPLARLERRQDWDSVNAPIREALQVLHEAAAQNFSKLEDLDSQQGMFGSTKFSPDAYRWAYVLKNNSAKALADAFKGYVEKEALSRPDTNSQMFAPSPVSKVEAFAETIGKLKNITRAIDLKSTPEARPETSASLPKAEAQGDKTGDAKRSDPRRGSIDPELLTLGAGKFIEHDVAPAVVDVVHGMRGTADDVLKIVAPTLRSPDAKQASLILRNRLSELARITDQAHESVRGAAKYFSRRSAEENFDFIDRMESGTPQGTPELDEIAGNLRTLLDQKRADVQALGTGKLDQFYENYFPHMWRRPDAAKSLFETFLRKRPLEGSKAFLKTREFPTVEDGRAAGLQPLTDNPVQLALLKAHEMDRYVMAHKALADWEKAGIATYLRPSQKAPTGWLKIEDPIGTSYGKSDKGELVIRGSWYAPEGAARVLNNYLSPGLRGSALYRALLGTNNALNQFQLGLSAFHLGFTTMDATVSKASLGYQSLFRGRPVEALKQFSATPTAAFTTYLKGDRLLKEWYRPGSQGAAIGNLVDNLVTAGGRARMDQMYRTHMGERLQEALRQGNIIGAAIRAPFAGVEALSGLIMNEVVPRMKLGAFADMARFQLENLPADATFEDARRVLTQAWDSVDNRLGEMVYDNLFLNKTVKDLAMLTTRSLGWNLGTLREIGGGLADIAVQPANALQGKPVNLNRLSYVLALTTIHAFTSATYQYLKTGKGPDELKDYFFPKNGEVDEYGRPQRSSLPSYVKDVAGYAMHPVRTVENKVAPIWSTFAEMIHNSDFYGTEIRNADDPLIEQLRQEAKFIGTTMLPLGVRNLQRESKLGGSTATKVEQFFGITPAPSDLAQSPAERLAHELAQAHVSKEPRTAEASARSDLRRSLARSLRAGKGIPADVTAARELGRLSKADIQDSVRASKQAPLQQAFNHLGVEDAVKVYAAADGDERKQILPMLLKKARGVMANEPPAEKQKTLAKLRSVLAAR